MQIIRHIHACPPDAQGCVLALGNFDGLHLGHQAIINKTIAIARQHGVPAAAMTFEPHPREFFARQKHTEAPAPLRLYPLRRKLELCASLGIERLFLVPFTADFAALGAVGFIENLLHRQLKVRHVVTGENFAFGHGRSGNTELLARYAETLGFGYDAIAPITDSSAQAFSSSAIRQALLQGNVALASQMLGRPYTISGTVRHGHKRGRELGFPTANISLRHLFRPAYGVYSAHTQIDGRDYDAIANIGIKPTVNGTEPLLEVHVFDANLDLYGRRLDIALGQFIRPEMRFESLEALRSQISRDIEQVHLIRGANA